jgi:hypothetical protein
MNKGQAGKHLPPIQGLDPSMSAFSPTDDHFEADNDERDYSSRLDDVLGNSDQEDGSGSDSEGFVYDGEDAEPSGPYREQLSEILEQNFDELDEIEDHEHVGNLLRRDAPSPLELAESEPVCISYAMIYATDACYLI